MDAGDIIHTSPTHDQRYSRFIVKGMNRMGYDAVTLGELELERGDAYVRDLVGQFRAKVVVSNVRPASGEPPWLESAVIEKGGKKIAIIGLLSANFGRAQSIEESGWKVEDPSAALARLVPELRRRADLVVALVHADPSTAQKLESEAQGVDLVVLGHMPGLTSIGQDSTAVTTVLRSGQKGEYLGRVTLAAAKSDKTKSGTASASPFVDPETIMLELKKMGDDADLAKELETIKAAVQNETRKAQMEKELAASEDLVLGQDRFLGQATCVRCHSSSAAELASDPHAHAFATLEKVGRATDKSCLPCHVTGYGAAGGFEGVGASVEMKNVQCESCHGMGTNHDWTGQTAAAGEAACLQCHVSEWSPKWEYATYLKRLGHGAGSL